MVSVAVISVLASVDINIPSASYTVICCCTLQLATHVAELFS